MRQAGVLAAAGIYALEHMTVRLADDHRRAARLAEGIQNIPGIQFEMGLPPTNMVFPSFTKNVPHNAAEIAKRLKEQGILAGVVAERRLRMVTHYWIDDAAVNRTIEAFRKILD